MKNGFYTALGTPFDDDGNFITGSFKRQIDDQIDAGASGLLVMGSMGLEPYIRSSEYIKVARASVEAAKGRCAILVGVMDTSINRVKDRIKDLDTLKIDGIVATVPYYYTLPQEEIREFFSGIAQFSRFPVYLYDLPVVTQTKISISTVESLMALENIRGIKTGDLATARTLFRSVMKTDSFDVFFSGLDVFDIAYGYGLKLNLDGMFGCTAAITSAMYKCLENKEFDLASRYLDEILLLRDTFAKIRIFTGYSYAMNLLGYEGTFAPDYSLKVNDTDKEIIRDCMKKCRLI